MLERLDDDSGDVMVAQLSIDDADFWIQDDPDARPAAHGGSVRMILSVDDPEALLARALAAGATEVSPISEGHGVESGKSRGPVRTSLGDRPSTPALTSARATRTTVVERIVAIMTLLDGALVRLRPPTCDDIPDLVAIRETAEVYRWWRGGDDMAAAIEEDLEEVDITAYVIEHEDRVVGWIQSHEETDPDYRHANIDIYVDPAVHNGGSAPTRCGRLRSTCASTSATIG